MSRRIPRRAPATSHPTVRRRLIVAALIAVIGAVALVPAAAVAQDDISAPPVPARYRDRPIVPNDQRKGTLADIENDVLCLQCGVPLSQAEEAPQANRERELIRALYARGLTTDQVRAEMVSEYGDAILATPSTKGFDLAAWLVPGLGILAGLVVIAVAVIRWRRRGSGGPGRPGTGGSGPRLSDDEARRLDADIARTLG